MEFQLSTTMNLTNSDIKSAVSSYIGSKKYIKKMVPLSITYLLYWRVNLDKNTFKEHNIKNFHFCKFSSRCGNKIVERLYKSSIAAMDAVDKGYLKELFFIIFDTETDKALEIYKYKFSYKENSEDPSLLPSSQDVLNQSAEFFGNIKKLGQFEKLPRDVSYKFEIIYNDDAPVDYVPDLFHAPKGIEYYKQYQQKSNIIRCGAIDTGYHMMRLFGHLEQLSTSRPVTPASIIEIGSEAGNSEASLEMESMKEFIENEVVPRPTPDENILCSCELPYNFTKIELITCSKCFKKQHVPCMCYYLAEDIPADYVCLACGDNEVELYKTFSEADKKKFTLYRLVIWYSYINQKTGEEIINTIEDSFVQVDIWNKLKRSQIYKSTDAGGLEMGSHDVTISYLSTVFNKQVPEKLRYVSSIQTDSTNLLEEEEESHLNSEKDDSLELPRKRLRNCK